MISFKIIVLIIFLVLIKASAFAQCAMCKAVVESNAQSGDSIVEGVNNAILYLMGIPYLLIAVVGIMWHKKFLKNETDK